MQENFNFDKRWGKGKRNRSRICKDIFNQMKDLLKFDKKSEDKLKDFDHFTTGQLSLTTYSRTFYIVKTDGSKEVKIS